MVGGGTAVFVNNKFSSAIKFIYLIVNSFYSDTFY